MKLYVAPWSEVRAALESRHPRLFPPADPATGEPPPVEFTAEHLLALFDEGYDLQLTHHRPHQTRRAKRRDGEAEPCAVLQVSPGFRGFHQR